MVQEDSDRGGGYLCDAGDFPDVLYHVTDNVLSAQDLQWTGIRHKAKKSEFGSFKPTSK